MLFLNQPCGTQFGYSGRALIVAGLCVFAVSTLLKATQPVTQVFISNQNLPQLEPVRHLGTTPEERKLFESMRRAEKCVAESPGLTSSELLAQFGKPLKKHTLRGAVSDSEREEFGGADEYWVYDFDFGEETRVFLIDGRCWWSKYISYSISIKEVESHVNTGTYEWKPTAPVRLEVGAAAF